MAGELSWSYRLAACVLHCWDWDYGNFTLGLSVPLVQVFFYDHIYWDFYFSSGTLWILWCYIVWFLNLLFPFKPVLQRCPETEPVHLGLCTEAPFCRGSGLQYGTLHNVLGPADTVGLCLWVDSYIRVQSGGGDPSWHNLNMKPGHCPGVPSDKTMMHLSHYPFRRHSWIWWVLFLISVSVCSKVHVHFFFVLSLQDYCCCFSIKL